MGLIVEGEKCPICNGYVFEEDDLVFCPVCGAPHHRSCYESVGHCALEEFHGTDKQYQKPTAPTEENRQDNAKSKAKHRDNLNGATFNSSADAGGIGYTPFGANIAFDPMGGVGKEEKIEDVKATKIRDFVMVNTQRYLPKFKTLNKKKKSSWNWAAFLLPYTWFFYRKMYFQGIFALIFSIIGELLCYPVIFSPVLDTANPTGPQMAEQIMSLLNSDPMLYFLLLAGSAILVAIRVFAGIFGDWFYRSSVLSGIKSIENEDGETELLYRKKGGVNILLGLVFLSIGSNLSVIIYSFIA